MDENAERRRVEGLRYRMEARLLAVVERAKDVGSAYALKEAVRIRRELFAVMVDERSLGNGAALSAIGAQESAVSALERTVGIDERGQPLAGRWVKFALFSLPPALLLGLFVSSYLKRRARQVAAERTFEATPTDSSAGPSG